MKNIKILFIAFLGICQTLNSSAQTSINANKDAIENFRKNYEKSMLTENIQSITDRYSENIRLMPEFQKTVLGKKNMMLYYTAFFNRFDIQQYNRDTIEILDLGQRIVELGYFTMHIKSSSAQHELKGKYQNIWEKLPDGKLMLITEAWNYNHWVDFADQLRFDNLPAVHMAMQAHLPINNYLTFELAGLNCLMEKTISQGDARIWSQFFTDDAMFIYSFNVIYKGKKQLDEYLEKHVKELPVFEKLDIRNDKIDESNNYVIEYATHIANWRSGDSSGISTGKNIRIWRREPTGSLKIFRQMAMYD
jgi:ketosteroid isomerase-like protein